MRIKNTHCRNALAVISNGSIWTKGRYRTLIGSHTLRVGWYHRRAASTTGSARNRVLVPFDFGTRRRGYYPHSGLVSFNSSKLSDHSDFLAKCDVRSRQLTCAELIHTVT